MRIEDLIKGKLEVEIELLSGKTHVGIITSYNEDSITLKRTLYSSDYKSECIIIIDSITIINILAQS